MLRYKNMQTTDASACRPGAFFQSCHHFTECCSVAVCGHEANACRDGIGDQPLIRAPPANGDHDDENSTTITKTTKSPSPTTTKDDEAITTTKKEETTTTKKDDNETTGAQPTTKSKSTSPTTTRKTTEDTTSEPSTLVTSPSTPLPPTATSTLPTDTAISIPTPGATTQIITIAPPETLPPNETSSEPAPAPSAPSAQGDQNSTTTAVAAGIGGTVTLALVLFLIWWLIRKRRHSKRMSSVRGNSPLGFDDKIGTAEGHNATLPNLGGVLPGEAQSQHQTSVNSNTTSSTRYGTTIPTNSQGGAPPGFRYGSLQNPRSRQGVPNQAGIPEEPSLPVVSPLTPASDYGAPPLPPLPYGAATHRASPVDYGHGVAHAQRQPLHQSHGSREPCGDRHDDQWPWNPNSDDGYLHAQYPPNNYVSPMSPNFPAQQSPLPPMHSQPQYQAYRPSPSRTSSGGSNPYYRVNAAQQYTGPRPPSRTPPPGSVGGQQARNVTPHSLQPGNWSQSPNSQHQQHHSLPPPIPRPVQAVPRLVSVGNSVAGSSSSRRPSPAPEAELQGSDVPATSARIQDDEPHNSPETQKVSANLKTNQVDEIEDHSIPRGTGVLQIVNGDNDIQEKQNRHQSQPEQNSRDPQVTASATNF